MTLQLQSKEKYTKTQGVEMEYWKNFMSRPHCKWQKIYLGEKFGYMDLIMIPNKIQREVRLFLPLSELKKPHKEVKRLEIILESTLNFDTHVEKKMKQWRNTICAIWRLRGMQKVMSGSAVQSLYIACVGTVIEYNIEVWQHRVLNENFSKLNITKNMALLQILRAY